MGRMDGSENPAEKYIGKIITDAKLNDNRFHLTFDDGVKIVIFDNGQSCCEYRYMSTDDDVSSLIGHKLLDIESKDGPYSGDDDGLHETCFVEIGTDDNFITLVNHNEHNGYYGGFGLNISEI